MPCGNKPLLEPMLNYHQWGPVAFTWRWYYRKNFKVPMPKMTLKNWHIWHFSNFQRVNDKTLRIFYSQNGRLFAQKICIASLFLIKLNFEWIKWTLIKIMAWCHQVTNKVEQDLWYYMVSRGQESSGFPTQRAIIMASATDNKENQSLLISLWIDLSI